MQPSTVPRSTLIQAQASLTAMERATNLTDLEERWKEFLHRVERVWNKAEAHFSRSPKWAGWHGRYQLDRRKDELLVYLKNARDVEEHSIEPVTELQMGGIGLNPADRSKPITFKHLTISGGEFSFEADQPVEITVTAPRVRLLPVMNRGRTYPVPTQHLGQPVDSSNVLGVARAALDYYANFLNSAERYFWT